MLHLKDNSILMIPQLRSIFLLLALCFLLFFWGLGDIPFYSRGESREGLVVLEMYTTGNWILPLVNGEYIPFKPPLFHWVGVVIASLLGYVSEFIIRFPSALFGLLGVALTYAAGRRLWGEQCGFIAAIVLATSPEWWRAATIAQVDMTLTFFILAALLQFLFVYQERRSGIGESMALALLLGLATLAKGPVGVVLPSLVILGFLWLQRDLAFIKGLHLFAGVVFFLLAAGSWYALAGLQAGTAVFTKQIVEESLFTAVGTYGHFQPPYYFIPVLFLNMLPWSLFFPSLALFLYAERYRLEKEKWFYLLVWFLTVLLFFSLARGKRGIYILPLYPAAALIFGAWWQKLEKGEGTSLWLIRLVGYSIAGCCLLASGILLMHVWGRDVLDLFSLFGSTGKLANLSNNLQALISPSLWVWVCVTLFSMAAVSLIWALARKKWNWVFVSLTVIAVALTLAAKHTYYRSVASERTLKPFMVRVTQRVDPTISLFFYHSFDFGSIFYSGRHISSFQTNSGPLERPFFLLMWEEDWKRLAGRKGLEMLDISEGTGPVGRHRMVLVKVTENVQFSELVFEVSAAN